MRVLLLGGGAHAHSHLRAYDQLRAAGHDVEVVGIVDPDAGRGSSLAARWGAAWHRDVSTVDPASIDAADLCTPTASHPQLGAACAQRRWPTLIEKPLAATLAGADDIIEAFTRTGTALTAGHSTRFVPAVAALAREARSGAIGSPLLVSVAQEQGYAWPGGWRAWQLDEAASGGRIVHLAIHDIDVACWLMGSRAELVRAVGSRGRGGPGAPWASVAIQISFTDRLALITASWEAQPARRWRKRCLVVGSTGELRLDTADDEAVDPPSDLDPTGYQASIEIQLAAWLASVRDGTESPVPLDEARQSLAVAEAAQRSAVADGAVVDVREVLDGR